MKKVLLFGRYELYEDGRIYARPHRNGNRGGGHNGKWLKPSIGKHGYKIVTLKTGNRKYKQLLLHRLLAEAFIPNPENKCCVNHKDGNKLNNSLDNLEWVTYSENNQHAYDNGLSKKLYGKEHSRSKKVAQKTKDGKIIKIWDCAMDAQRIGGFYASHINAVANKKRKTHKGYVWEFI